MKVLITGAAGFIGSTLARRLLDRGDEVIGIDNLNDYYDVELKKARLAGISSHENFTDIRINIEDREAVFDVFKKYKPSRVVNLAAQAGVRYSLENPHAYVNTNIVGFLNILEGCRHHDVEHLVFASSSSVYGANTNYPFSIHNNVDHPVSLYAASKKSNELMAHTYSHLFNLPTTGLRFFTVYGPWGRPDMAMYIFADKISKGEPIPVFNNGNMKRDFTFIDDIIAGTRAAIDKNYECEVFNLGNHRSEELMYMIKLIEEDIARKAIIDFQPMQAGDVPESFSDIEKSIKKLNYKSATNIDLGIKYFIDWYKEYTNQ